MSQHQVTVSTVTFIVDADSVEQARDEVEEKLRDIAWDWGAISP